ncbi:heavy metal translocating P-type ATPase [Helicobacter sp. WB40]|uniref:heavy metal translocating P-type ATPase n=1 Tax=Helicobacter sp. WB40 TaxID=3004130 RepID=UPI0022EBAB04|nr:heavy metal translocating P-type ATPase [Helicobacter sp. WB40]MDA3966767.1 heavy metal translocating P-type ATPase [Helicobacter sp. WB40]
MRKCDHCHLEFDDDSLHIANINGKDKYFCCNGCEGVYRLLDSEDLGGFYDKLGSNTLSPVSKNTSSLNQYDTEAFIEKYVSKDGDKCSISLVLEKIHCVACIWLNERILLKQNGIFSVNINYTNNKANIVFDITKIKPSQIVKIVRLIGYDAHVYDASLQENYARKEKRDYYIKLSVGIFCVMNIMWIAVAQYAGYFSGISNDMRDILNVAGFVLSTPVLFFSGIIFWRGAIAAFRHKMPNMDLLVISGATLAYVYSIYASFTGGETYFESVAMIITFVLFGKFLEIRGKNSAADSLDRLNSQMPLDVNVIRDSKSVRVPVREVEVGEIVSVCAGERIALDGELISEVALCDESSISGESELVEKAKGDRIYSGTMAINFAFNYKIGKQFKNSIMTSIVNMVEDSLNTRPKIENLATNISRYFSLVMFVVAGIAFCVWYFALGSSFDRSLMVAISVIIIACPCALALATPLALLVGIGEAINKKILFKESKMLETISHATTLVLDKTGTITKGALSIKFMKSFMNLKDSNYELQVLIQIINQNSHPISLALRNEFSCHYEFLEFTSIEEISTKGVVAKINNDLFLAGNFELLLEYGVIIGDEILDNDYEGSIFCFAKNDKLLLFCILEDEIKEEAYESISRLKGLGLRIVLLSGDNKRACEKVANSLKIDEYYYKQTPLDKANFIDRLHKEGEVVVMAGDGINDSVALSKSDIAIAMGGGIDLAISVSDVVVLDSKMSGVLDSFIIGKNTYKFIKQNLAISLIYNAFTIPLAMAGFVIPLIAALSMSLSSLVVVLNSLRLKNI